MTAPRPVAWRMSLPAGSPSAPDGYSTVVTRLDDAERLARDGYDMEPLYLHPPAGAPPVAYATWARHTRTLVGLSANDPGDIDGRWDVTALYEHPAPTARAKRD